MHPVRQQGPRGGGDWNDLHRAKHAGLIKSTVALLSRGEVDINQCSAEKGGTALLVVAAVRGYLSIVRILLNKEADVFIAA